MDDHSARGEPRFGYIAACLASPAAWIMADLFQVPAYFIVWNRLKRQGNNPENSGNACEMAQ